MLRNRDINNIIDDCDYYRDTIENVRHIRPWTVMPLSTFNKQKKCRQLEERSSLFNPKTRNIFFDRIFSYRSKNPARLRKLELFENANANAGGGISNYVILFITVVIFLFSI